MPISPDCLSQNEDQGPGTDRHKPDKLSDEITFFFKFVTYDNVSFLSDHSELGASGSRRVSEDSDIFNSNFLSSNSLRLTTESF